MVCSVINFNLRKPKIKILKIRTMNKIILLIFFMLVNVIVLNAQQVIQLYSGKAPGTENWNWQEHEKAVPFRHVYNVVKMKYNN